MFKVSLYTVGSIPKGPFQDIAVEFQKRLGKFCDYVERPYRDEQKLVEAIPTGSVIIVLDAEGKEMSSEAFASKLEQYLDAGDKLVFVLGGPHGLSDELKKRAHLCLSLSQMTTTHDLAHVFFLEQLYRGFTIVKGIQYHY